MDTTLYTLAIGTYIPMLTSLSGLLEKAKEQAPGKGLDLAALPTARLAPDMFPLYAQVHIACFHAQDGIARLSGRESPPRESGEEPVAQLQGRIVHALEAVKGATEKDFEGAEARTIVIPRPDDATIEFRMSGLQFLRDWSLPHFYFHVVTAYDILRHVGVEIGKRDYASNVGRYLVKRDGA